MVDVSEVSASYGSGPVLDRVSFSLAEGRIGCIVGPSGCGKSTLLRSIAGFEPVTTGSIQIDGETVSTAAHMVPPEQRRVGVVFQDYALFPHLTVAANIGFGLRGVKADDSRERVASLLKAVDMQDYAKRYPHELSGGQQQRVALARALAPEPKLLLLDEPFSNLDPDLKERMKKEIMQLLREFGVTAIMVTHNQDEAFDIGDELGVMVDGVIQQWGHPYDLYHRPCNRNVAEFLGVGAFLPVEITNDGTLTTELGAVCYNGSISALRSKTRIWLLLRPDDIVHDDACRPIAKVTAVAFRGMYRVYDLELPSGEQVHCFTSSHHELHPIGSRIGVKLDVKHTVLLTE